ncbi:MULTISPECIES: DUF4276 family protein [unclassified Pseudomonas]|uniref:DUF4276 family protein n=1 Tax=unclassified Pseudomonas TaxID=196821 RepID=UPI0011A9E815|nr:MULTISPECIES: DUF4276 family protein [unclassified Pseudomonas]TWC16206.1 uncharacterized protein DUF4276 [Pseudomonas sp. SJZ075]TWC32168.1 uncharacterized protein DUF4276 [Pseudomonas sp. SJZ078]TWC53329.1 uncharacterized protein DUF4276 [Pseudomonas sp. SJZ124]TWC87844.1 uncharacterized protein DUF4276 [Pseudomonas sp. SJZ101]
MVKVGFIVEGDSEKIVIESADFRALLLENDFELVNPVVNAKGGGNLLPQNIDAYLTRLDQQAVDRIVVLTDLEDEESVDVVRARVSNDRIDITFVAVKALEGWFLADSSAIRKWLDVHHFDEPQPEQTLNKPWDRLKEISNELGKRGPGNKTAFAKKMVKHYGFSIRQAASHPECPSAKELVSYFTRQGQA